MSTRRRKGPAVASVPSSPEELVKTLTDLQVAYDREARSNDPSIPWPDADYGGRSVQDLEKVRGEAMKAALEARGLVEQLEQVNDRLIAARRRIR